MNREERKRLNKEFIDFNLHSSIPSMRKGLVANLLLFLVFAAVNELFLPGKEELQFFMRFGIIIPFFLISILVLFFRKLQPYLSTIFIIINILLAVTVFVVGVSSNTGEWGFQYYYAWVMLMTIGLYTFYRLPFPVLISLGLLILVAYILASIFNHSFQDNFTLALNNLFFVVGTAVLGFFIAYTFQLLNKKNFLHQKALDAQYKRLLAEFNEKTKMEDELRQASEQKMIMMKEIHHRVKNNLAIVISMLSLQMRQISDPQFKRIISDIEMRIRSMALIHEHLYRSEDLDRIKLHEYLKALTSIILSSFSSPVLNLETDFEPMDVSIETALPIGLIVNELLTNSIKYAFPSIQNGTIYIRLKKSNNQVSLLISDNGVGLPEGFQMEEQKTMGMFIVKLLVEQINGEIHVDNSQGTSFTVNFPLTVIRKPFNK